MLDTNTTHKRLQRQLCMYTCMQHDEANGRLLVSPVQVCCRAPLWMSFLSLFPGCKNGCPEWLKAQILTGRQLVLCCTRLRSEGRNANSKHLSQSCKKLLATSMHICHVANESCARPTVFCLSQDNASHVSTRQEASRSHSMNLLGEF